MFRFSLVTHWARGLGSRLDINLGLDVLSSWDWGISISIGTCLVIHWDGSLLGSTEAVLACDQLTARYSPRDPLRVQYSPRGPLRALFSWSIKSSELDLVWCKVLCLIEKFLVTNKWNELKYWHCIKVHKGQWNFSKFWHRNIIPSKISKWLAL